MATGRQIALGVFCFLLIFFPYKAFDHYDARLLIGGELLILAAGLIALHEHRRYLLLTFGTLILFLVIGETVFRVQYFGLQGLSLRDYCPADYSHPLSNFEYDENTYTHRKPDTQVMFKGGRFTVNNVGFRGGNWSQTKPDNVYRIVLIGASACMGSGVDDEETYAAVLERKLNTAHLPKQVEILNLSVAGNTTGQMIHTLKTVGLSYEPDLILLMGNEGPMQKQEPELRPPEIKKFEGPRWKLFADGRMGFFSARFFFIQLIKKARSDKLELPTMFAQRTVGRAEQEKTDISVDMNTYAGERSYIEANVATIRETAGEAPVALYLLKPIMALHDESHNLEYRTYLKVLAKRYDMKVIDTYDADYSGYTERDLLLYPGEGHPNRICHGIYAERIFEDLFQIAREHIR